MILCRDFFCNDTEEDLSKELLSNTVYEKMLWKNTSCGTAVVLCIAYVQNIVTQLENEGSTPGLMSSCPLTPCLTFLLSKLTTECKNSALMKCSIFQFCFPFSPVLYVLIDIFFYDNKRIFMNELLHSVWVWASSNRTERGLTTNHFIQLKNYKT